MIKNIRDSYKQYKKQNDNAVDIKIYVLLTGEYNKFLIEKVLEGEEVSLPSRLGTFLIIGRKQKITFDEKGNVKGLAPDWVKTKKLWDSNSKAKEKRQLVFHTNDHTDNIRYKILWSKNRSLVENKTLYSLRFTRHNKRAVYSNILKGKEYRIR